MNPYQKLADQLEDYSETISKLRNSLDNIAQDLYLIAGELKEDNEQSTK